MFSVEQPLLLRKTLLEHIKFLIKDGMMLLGIDRKNWGSHRKNYHKPGQMQKHLLVPRLDKESLAEIVDYADAALKALKDQLQPISDDEIRLSIEYQTASLIRSVLDMGRTHNRVVDIGSSYARVDAILAKEYPDATWDMVDFPTTLEQENQDIKLDNMGFHSAYGLEFLEQTDKQYDIVIFNRTFTMMGRSQIAEYLKVLRGKARYIVFGEPCWIEFEPGNLNIDRISLDFPRSHGSFLVHNYRALVEAEGYRVLHYDAQREPRFDGLHFLIRGVIEPINDETNSES
jgi:hypothetical protein